MHFHGALTEGWIGNGVAGTGTNSQIRDAGISIGGLTHWTTVLAPKFFISKKVLDSFEKSLAFCELLRYLPLVILCNSLEK